VTNPAGRVGGAARLFSLNNWSLVNMLLQSCGWAGQHVSSLATSHPYWFPTGRCSPSLRHCCCS